MCAYLFGSDEFELKFPELSRSELKRFQAELSRAGHFNFQAEVVLDFFLIYSFFSSRHRLFSEEKVPFAKKEKTKIE